MNRPAGCTYTDGIVPADQPLALSEATMTPPPSPHRRVGMPRLLIIGCGDVGMRVVRLLTGRWRIFALTSSPARVQALRAAGVVPLMGDLDQAQTLARLLSLAPRVLHLAPPPVDGGDRDPRTRRLLRVLARGGAVERLVYASTSGVYGDAQGAWVHEWRQVAPATDRAMRRVDAEREVRRYGHVHGACASILRVPGIYAPDRPDGDPVERVRRGTPVLTREEDVHTNRIHADDLARACVAALTRAAPQRVYHVSDDCHLPMGDYMDLVADRAGLPRPERITRSQAAQRLSPMALSFWSESRRLHNDRLKRELRVVLRHPTVEHVVGIGRDTGTTGARSTSAVTTSAADASANT